MRKIILPALLIMSPSAAVACDMDGLPGFGGMHRYNHFLTMRDAPAPQPAEPSTVRQEKKADREQSRPTPAERKPATDTPTADEPRKWEVEGGAPVSAEDKSTFA